MSKKHNNYPLSPYQQSIKNNIILEFDALNSNLEFEKYLHNPIIINNSTHYQSKNNNFAFFSKDKKLALLKHEKITSKLSLFKIHIKNLWSHFFLKYKKKLLCNSSNIIEKELFNLYRYIMIGSFSRNPKSLNPCHNIYMHHVKNKIFDILVRAHIKRIAYKITDVQHINDIPHSLFCHVIQYIERTKNLFRINILNPHTMNQSIT